MHNGEGLALLILAIFIGFIVMVVVGIYQCVKESKKEDSERAQHKMMAEEKLKIEMDMPKSYICFTDSGREEHISKAYNPYVTSNRFLRNDGEYYSVVSSSRVAGFALKEAYEKGYIRDAEGNTFPTCNLHKLSIVVQK